MSCQLFAYSILLHFQININKITIKISSPRKYIACVSLFPSSLNFLLDQSFYFIFKLFVPVNDWKLSSKALLKPEGTESKEQGQL